MKKKEKELKKQDKNSENGIFYFFDFKFVLY